MEIFEDLYCTYDIEGGCTNLATTLVNDKMYCYPHAVEEVAVPMVYGAVKGTADVILIVVLAIIALRITKVLTRSRQ